MKSRGDGQNQDKLVVEAAKILADDYKYYKKRNPEFDVTLKMLEGPINLCYISTDRQGLVFFDALIKILRKTGHDAVIDSGTNIMIGVEYFKIEVKEKATRSMVSDGTWKSSILIPNSKLYLKIIGYGGREWKDGKTLLKAQLPDILFNFEQ